jgi:23S rRNA-/tRNA-specific pseudouridylate synthase
VFVLALNKKAAATASLLFKERSVKKSYLALVTGHLKEQRWISACQKEREKKNSYHLVIS